MTAAVAASVALLLGCASTPEEYRDPRDPLEDFNRAMYRFNDELDKAVIKPVAQGYKAVTPPPVDLGITNFFSNLQDVGSALNNLLQLKLERAGSDVGRVVVNTTVGVLGFVDVASNMDMPKYGEDFGQTLGVWGMGPGPYIVLPVLGPSSARDTVGLVGDWYTDPVTYVHPWELETGLSVLRVVDQRADLLTASRVVEEAALDPYEFTKDAYIQKRRNDVFDGSPPAEPDDF
jgi:phospholipid-binding lipoprotein MlaA